MRETVTILHLSQKDIVLIVKQEKEIKLKSTNVYVYLNIDILHGPFHSMDDNQGKALGVKHEKRHGC
jgi:hypothetical protein